ncbi:MAG: hypothetical protein HY862_18640 [Chloroflexi bacterium]|nr:hypothetical protein [Chloroflexota bacterium]
MRLLIWGASPLGGWLAARLHHSQHEVTWLADTPTNASLTRALVLVTGQTHQKIEGLRILTDPREALKPLPDWVIFAMPGWGLGRAVTQLAMTAAPEKLPYVLSLQPGIGSLEKLTSLLGAEKSLRVVITRQFTWADVTHQSILMGISGGFVVSEHPQSALVGKLLQQAGLGSPHTAPVESLGWSDVFWRLHANALPSLLNISPAAVYTDPALWEIEYRQLREAIAVIDRLNISLVKLPGVNVPRLAWQVRLLPPRWLARTLKRRVGLPSLRDDLEQQSGHSDAAYLNGAVAQAAYGLQLSAAVNHVLALSLTDVGEGRVQWSHYHNNLDYLQTLIRVASRHV